MLIELNLCQFCRSDSQSISDVSASGLGRAHDFHDLAPSDTKVPGDRVLALDLGKLILFSAAKHEILVNIFALGIKFVEFTAFGQLLFDDYLAIYLLSL